MILHQPASLAARPSSSQRNDVQGLRGVAIAAVLLFHFFPEFFPNGFLGVDVFFVISGFLIVRIFGRALEKSGGFLTAAVVGDFYFRRFRRILPLHLLYCAVAIDIFSWQVDMALLEEAQKSALAALAFCTNIRALLHKYDYFEHVLMEDLFTHVWSLSVEIQFYLLVPLLFGINAIFSRYVNHRVFFIAASALSISLYVSSSSIVSFQFVLSRLWQFFAVACIEQNEPKYAALPTDDEGVSLSKEKPSSFLMNMTLSLSSLVILISIVPFVEVNPLVARIGVTLSSAVLIAYGMEPVMLLQRTLLSQRLLVWLGDVSYSLYLVHWPLATYFVHNTEVYSFGRLALIPTAIAISGFLQRYYETRYRDWNRKTTAKSCVALLLLSLGLLVASSTVNDYSHRVSDMSIAEAVKANRYAFSHGEQNLLLKECNYTGWQNWTSKQMADAHNGKPLGYCEMPKGEGRLRFLVIGNSYATNQADLVHRHFKPFFSSFTVYSQSACEILAVFMPFGYCGTKLNFTTVIDYVKPDVIFLIQRYGIAKKPLVPAGKPDPVTDEMLRNLLDVENRTSLLFLLDSYPAFNYNEMHKMNDYFIKNMSSYEINKRTVDQEDDVRARPRTQILAKKCKKCIMFDVEPPLRCGNFSMCSFDVKTHLSYFEPSAHFTPHGKKTIEPVYKALSRQYAKRLKELKPRND